jgi:hypothetical protein
MTTATKINMINEALVKSGASVKESAKAEIVDGKIVYTKERKNATCVTRIRLTFKEILWMMNSQDAIAIKNMN